MSQRVQRTVFSQLTVTICVAAAAFAASPAHAQFYSGMNGALNRQRAAFPSSGVPSETRGAYQNLGSRSVPVQSSPFGGYGFADNRGSFPIRSGNPYADSNPFADSDDARPVFNRFQGLLEGIFGARPSWPQGSVWQNQSRRVEEPTDERPAYGASAIQRPAYEQGTRQETDRQTVLPPDRVLPRRESPSPILGRGASSWVNPQTNPLPSNGTINIYGTADGVYTSVGPPLLGGYYYGDYAESDYGNETFPSVFSAYDGFPAYIDSVGPGVSVLEPSVSPYVTSPETFYAPVYNATYNQNNYYVTNPNRADEIDQGGAAAKAAIQQAYPADSFQAAFADIEKSWTNGDVALLKKHLRSNDTKVSVFLGGGYQYSLNSSDFAQITRDAFDRLDTVSFKFTEIQKAKNGDITAYGTHVYRPSPDSAPSSGSLTPFDADSAPTESSGTDSSGTDSGGAAPATEKTVYVSYTLRHGDDGWYVTAIDSSPQPLVSSDTSSGS